MTELEKISIKLKNLKQNKNLSNEQIMELAKEELERRNIVDTLAFCVDEDEKKLARELLDRYLSQGSVESESDKDTLKSLIDLQIIAERIKKNLNTEAAKANAGIPTHVLQELRETNEQIQEFKEKLGLTQKNRQSATFLDTWDKLKRKAVKYYEEHKGCNVTKCPYCQNIIQSVLRTDLLTPEKFKDPRNVFLELFGRNAKAAFFQRLFSRNGGE